MRSVALLCLLISTSACRYLAAPQPTVSPERPALLSSGGGSDPTRQPAALPNNRCGVACGAGRHCDEKSAECVVDAPPAARDAGVPWLP